MVYNPVKIGNECSCCDYFESLKVDQTPEELAKINQRKIEFLKEYNKDFYGSYK